MDGRFSQLLLLYTISIVCKLLKQTFVSATFIILLFQTRIIGQFGLRVWFLAYLVIDVMLKSFKESKQRDFSSWSIRRMYLITFHLRVKQSSTNQVREIILVFYDTSLQTHYNTSLVLKELQLLLEFSPCNCT